MSASCPKAASVYPASCGGSGGISSWNLRPPDGAEAVEAQPLASPSPETLSLLMNLSEVKLESQRVFFSVSEPSLGVSNGGGGLSLVS